jgi:hypothetical protein
MPELLRGDKPRTYHVELESITFIFNTTTKKLRGEVVCPACYGSKCETVGNLTTQCTNCLGKPMAVREFPVIIEE